MPPRHRFATPALAGTVLVALAACSDPFGFPPPHAQNVVDTVALYAVDGTPLATPSAYLLALRQRVRTDQSANFDFAFNIDASSRVVLLPTGAVGLGRASGLQLATQVFDSIKVAPAGGYVLDQAVVVDVDVVALVRSRAVGCSFGLSEALYAKLHVLAIDLVDRRIDFEILVNQNCGYKGLEPGFPIR
jgi:hypothetical protein